MTNANDKIDVGQWQHEFVGHVITEVFRQLEIQETDHGTAFADKAAASILASFVTTLVTAALRDRPSEITSFEAMQTYVSKNFSAAKDQVSQAVAMGVEVAASKFYGKVIPYYCLIKPVPEPINKTPC